MELYVHIPFCVRKCLYCDFLSFTAGKDLKERYINALIKELGNYSGLLNPASFFDTAFIGGGTPSLLDMENTEKLLMAVRPILRENAEFTVECNPGAIDPEKLSLYRNYGVNRLSIGLQSVNDKELEYLGRIHRYDDFLRSYEDARNAGFENINIDLMSGLPGQTVSGLEKTLRTVAGLAPEHISAYSLIIEPGTRFFEMYGDDSADDDGIPALPSEDEEREMFHLTARILAEYGYSRYEISNYSKPGYECRHNLGYWKGEEYLGAGIGAASYFNSTRYKNTDDIEKYIACAERGDWDALSELRNETEHIGQEESMEEYMILRLRLTEGISKEDFITRFGISVMNKYSNIIRKHIDNGLLIDSGDRLFLSERGLDLANTVMSDFLD